MKAVTKTDNFTAASTDLFLIGRRVFQILQIIRIVDLQHEQPALADVAAEAAQQRQGPARKYRSPLSQTRPPRSLLSRSLVDLSSALRRTRHRSAPPARDR